MDYYVLSQSQNLNFRLLLLANEKIYRNYFLADKSTEPPPRKHHTPPPCTNEEVQWAAGTLKTQEGQPSSPHAITGQLA